MQPTEVRYPALDVRCYCSSVHPWSLSFKSYYQKNLFRHHISWLPLHHFILSSLSSVCFLASHTHTHSHTPPLFDADSCSPSALCLWAQHYHIRLSPLSVQVNVSLALSDGQRWRDEWTVCHNFSFSAVSQMVRNISWRRGAVGARALSPPSTQRGCIYGDNDCLQRRLLQWGQCKLSPPRK